MSTVSPSQSKANTQWVTCKQCQCLMLPKDTSLHEPCPQPSDTWHHCFISNDVLHSTLQIYNPPARPKIGLDKHQDRLVFISQAAMEQCKIAISDPVIIYSKDTAIVKTAWPLHDKNILGVWLTRNVLELNDLQGLTKVKKAPLIHYTAREITVQCAGKYALSEMNSELSVVFKNYNEGEHFFIGNKICIPYYGRKLVYKIISCKSQMCGIKSKFKTNELEDAFVNLGIDGNELDTITVWKAIYSTKWTIFKDKTDSPNTEEVSKYRIEDIGGYDDLITDIKDVLDIGLGMCNNIGQFPVSKGILLYGTAGVGKSMLANAVISTYKINICTIHSSDIYSKSIGETEKKLKDIFIQARTKAPSIILIEDIDTLCPKRSTSNTDHERRVRATLTALFDDLHNTKDVLIFTTTSKLELVESSLRRPGRLDKEFEMYVPVPHMRTEILKKLLTKVPNTLSDQDVLDISFVTHGFVGADLYGLCSQAVMNAIKRDQKLSVHHDQLKVTRHDFNYALTLTKPSAMKEVLVEVPNVKWSDVGGQRDLKLKLKQAVEWPLRHPEAFVRMGITPPRGVLMFGPPGCSKTMIAKALATESNVNFLNIKGPELFSKWVGESEKAVREVFRKARQVAPSIIFIDEIDALGGERSSASTGNGSNVQERVLAQLLTELDGVTALGNVTLVAATNRPDKIDKALLRPGRLDRIIYVPLPDYDTRQEIFNIKLRNMPISQDVEIIDLVDLTDGYSGAEIQAICHEAAMKALEEDLNAAIIRKDHFKAALSVVTPRTPNSLIKLYDDYMNSVY